MTEHWYAPFFMALAAAGLIVLGCDSGSGGGGGEDTTQEPLVDTDGDTLYDVFEDEIGTDIELEDTDEDGFLDGEEWDAFTDPLDPDDYEYLDSSDQPLWDHFPYPPDLEGEGSQWGDVVDNFALPNYWGQLVNLYGFYGNVVYVVSTADS